jgi:hypothetical protein
VNKQIVRLGLSFSALGYMAFIGASGSSVVACSGNSSATTGPSNTGSTSTVTDDGGGSSSASTDTGGPTCDNGALLVDDMANQQTDGPGTMGYWYTYSDRTIPISEPPQVQLLSDGGMPPGSITPTEGASFPSNVPGPGMIANARQCSGSGEKTWGAGFGFDIIDALPDGGSVPFDQCEGGTTLWDNSPDAGSTGIPQPFDASAHKGVTFWAKSNGTASAKINVQFSEKRTSPWGGMCDPCVTSGMTACSDDYLIGELVPTTWKQFTIHWTDLATQNWTKQNLPKGMFDPKTWYFMHFQFSTNAGTALAAFDLSVACIEFTDN